MVLTVRALENAIGALREKAVAVHNRLSSVLCPDTEAGKVPVPTDRPQEISAPLRCVLLSDADRVSEVSDILDDILKRLEI